MSAILKAHIEKLLQNALPNYEGIERFFVPVVLHKKQNLLTEGTICRSNYFVVQGCLRMFFVNEKGVEQTVQFALERWWLADYTSFSAQSPSGFYIQAVEPSEILSLTHSAQEELLQAYPQLERYFRLVHQRAHAAAQFRIRILYGYSREALYHQFVRRYPEFVQRIPQYLLASFLGFTPEYLSELRGRSAS
ncbi:Crp/Fnr family transcriptional regulator [Spirosoma fluminis]